MNDSAQQPADHAVRARALAADASFLVQAPAGSGKTELLIQRLLRLLSSVEQPEQILAISFTRKAAAEMRERVLGALARARARAVPEEPHLRLGYELALAAVARDEALGWGLADQPGRLRIGTIDAVNAWLNARAPVTAGQQALNRVSDRPETLYREAARQALTLAGEPDSAGAAMRDFLRHCDNRTELAIQLIETMLARRDHWLRHTGAGEVDDGARAGLEAAIASFITSTLHRVDAQLPPKLKPELSELLAFAATNLAASDRESELLHWLDYPDFPPPTANAAGAWRGLACTLLTGSGTWRKPKGLNVRAGFPKEEAETKARMGELLELLAGDEALRAVLHDVQQLPDAHYTDSQWQSLKAIIRVLPLAAAVLQEVFAARGETDFTQLAGNALTTLGSELALGELSLVMDYSLRHILLDEYQDTSRSQFELLERLTAGWEQEDGRTLFLVGDPMQSIYRFREAEVGIFLETRTAGINGRPLEFLRLTTNFRSAPAIVDWVNFNFAQVMPPQESVLTGAVPLAPSQPHKPGRDDAGVQWHLLAHEDRDEEAQAIVTIVREALVQRPDESVGILVRSRAHAARIGPRLRAAGIEYSAPDLELLSEEPLVQDLLGLTRALTHLADRIAWLAVARAPWCGLTLADLHSLAAGDADSSVWTLLNDDALVATLSDDGHARAVRLRKQLEPWLLRRGAVPLRDVVEGAWQNLGGPACLVNAEELELAAEFFAWLDDVDEGGDCPDPVDLLDGVATRPSVRRAAHDARVQVMTMHKAKGLEFDTVILPALATRTRVSSKPLLIWQELAEHGGPAGLVLAPLHARGENSSPLFDSLWRVEKQREAFEQQRLLYVATTRARERLHLFASLPDDEEARPPAGSLLHVLWPAVNDSVRAQPRVGTARPEEAEEPQWREVSLRRLPADWSLPSGFAAPDWTQAGTSEPLEAAELSNNWARHAGTVAHRWLQEIAKEGAEVFDASRLAALRPLMELQLSRLGLTGRELELARDRVRSAVEGALADEEGRWVLSGRHADAKSEWGITQSTDRAGAREQRLDRSFIDRDGQRWIIDFKIAEPRAGEKEQAFVHRQQQLYIGQLSNYAAVVSALEQGKHPIRAALYFPLVPRLAEIPLVRSPASE